MRFVYLVIIILAAFFDLHAETFPIRNKTTYNFLIHVPDNVTETEKLTVIVFLHGRSLSGTNLERVKRYGVLYAKNKGHQLTKALIVAPQTNKGSSPDHEMEVIKYMPENYQADASSVDVSGKSMV